MKLTAIPSFDMRSRERDIAVSVCLYQSAKWNHSKHWKPFESMMEANRAVDVLVYHEPDHPMAEEASRLGARTFEVTSRETGWHRHLWRYIGADENYPLTWFRGTDWSIIPERERRLAEAAEILHIDAVIWQCPHSLCMGKLAAFRPAAKSLIGHMRAHDCNKPDTYWNCDEAFLGQWIATKGTRVMVAIDGPHEWQMEWVTESLMRGNHVVIVKDRDDRR